MDGANLELFPDLELGDHHATGRGCVRPIGRRTVRRWRRRAARPSRPSTAAMLAELRQFLERQHVELVEEIRRLGRHQSDEREGLPVLLRRILNIERHVGLVEDPRAPKPTRRNPMEA